VRRNEEIITVHHQYLHVGDIIIIKEGMYIPVDGIVLSANQLTVSEAAMTGESDELRKDTVANCMARLEEKNLEHKNEQKVGGIVESDKHEIPSPLLLSGTNVQGGEGSFVSVMVGDMSAIGQIIKELSSRPETTPLQEKLETIATDIGKLGTYVALLSVHVLLFRFFLEGLIKRNVDLFGGAENIECRDNPSVSKEDCDEMFAKAPKKPFEILSLTIALWLEYVIIGVAIIVVAVPEGLPLAVMISLAYSIKRMLKDNNDVKRLASCEIMGGADNICSDKTGTLTMNQMKVTNLWAGKDVEIPQTIDHNTGKMTDLQWKNFFSQEHLTQLTHSLCCNTPESENATDKATIELIERFGGNVADVRRKHLPAENLIRFPFSSKRKRMSTVLENIGNGGYDKRIHIKGASEIVLDSCSHYLDDQGMIREMTDQMKGSLNNVITTYAKKALRTITVGFKDLSPGEHGQNHDEHEENPVKEVEKSGFTLIAILGIMDIVRPEVPDSVLKVQRAGVTVRMVTGDNLITAMAIAENCHIITKEEIGNPKFCMCGPELYELVGGLTCKTCNRLSPQECDCKPNDRNEQVTDFKKFKEVASHVKVMARSRPEDKQVMVIGLKQMKAVVAVTGDGTNDATALKKADVGFAMGKVGTDVCKEAADILITDDNFTSIVLAVKWGRNVFDNIQRFLQFQLTVNVVALITTFIGSCITKETPLAAIQLLWVNLIMDSLASLALATEMPKAVSYTHLRAHET